MCGGGVLHVFVGVYGVCGCWCGRMSMTVWPGDTDQYGWVDVGVSDGDD